MDHELALEIERVMRQLDWQAVERAEMSEFFEQARAMGRKLEAGHVDRESLEALRERLEYDAIEFDTD